MDKIEAETTMEKILDGQDIEPYTEEERYAKRLYDKTQSVPKKPHSRLSYFLMKAGEGGGDITIKELTATENGDYSEEDTAYSPVHVAVPEPVLKTKSITDNGTYDASGDSADGYSSVTVDVQPDLTTKSITANGTYNASDDNVDGYSSVNVNVPLPANAYLLKSVPNLPQPIASFTDGSENIPLKGLKIAIEPVQSGSGDPSPENIRPISGFTEANVTRTGKNLWDNKWADYTQPSDYRICPIKLENGTYIASVKLKEGGTRQTGFTLGIAKKGDRYSNFGSFYTACTGDDKTGTITVDDTWTSPKLIIYCANETVFNAVFENYEIMLEKGSSATTYTPYNGHTYTIDLDGTRYGGEVDVVNGGGTDNMVDIDLGSLTWGFSDSINIFYANFTGYKKYLYNVMPNIKCEVFAPQKRIDLLNNVDGITLGNTGEYDNRILVRASSITDLSTFESLINGKKLVYELATPTTYDTQPTAIKSLRGKNNIFADTGDIEVVEYFSK